MTDKDPAKFQMQDPLRLGFIGYERLGPTIINRPAMIRMCAHGNGLDRVGPGAWKCGGCLKLILAGPGDEDIQGYDVLQHFGRVMSALIADDSDDFPGGGITWAGPRLRRADNKCYHYPQMYAPGDGTVRPEKRLCRVLPGVWRCKTCRVVFFVPGNESIEALPPPVAGKYLGEVYREVYR